MESYGRSSEAGIGSAKGVCSHNETASASAAARPSFALHASASYKHFNHAKHCSTITDVDHPAVEYADKKNGISFLGEFLYRHPVVVLMPITN
jgi:hypothetical protein